MFWFSRNRLLGSYSRFTGDAEPDKVRASYPPATYARLVAVKREYDPSNLDRKSVV